MKKLIYFFAALLSISTYSYSQGEVDAIKYSRDELYGTARSMAMGGAFGALGGDLTGVSINPAGIGVYRSSEVSGTLGLQQNKASVGNLDKSVLSFNLHNLGFVGYFPLRSESVPMINFGFSFNRQKEFDNKILAKGNPKNSLLSYIADRSYGLRPDNLLLPKENSNLPDPFLSQPWISVLAYNSYLINPHIGSDGKYYYTPLNEQGTPINNQINTREKGYIDDYDFTIGTSINNVLNVGISLTVSDVNHYQYNDYAENFNAGHYLMNNEISLTGAGFGAKFGLIYKPVNSFRIGLAYHTPTWYSLQEYYQASIDDKLTEVVTVPNDIRPAYQQGKTYSAQFSNSYELTTPDKWVISLAGVLGGQFIVSMDYEMTDYKKMKLGVPSGSHDQQDWYTVDNNFIKQDFRMASTVKFGMEYRFNPQLYGRLGYAWMQNPYKTEFREAGNAGIFNSNLIHALEGDTNYFTGGLGYRFNQSFYADMALVYKTREDKLFSFPNIYADENNTNIVVDSSPFAMTSNSFRGVLTFGYRF